MDLTATMLPPSGAPAPDSGATRAALRVAVQTDTEAPRAAAPEAERTRAIRQPAMSRMRVKLAIDEATGRVFGQLIDSESGEVVDTIPKEALLKLYAKTQEMLGPLVKTVA